MTSARVRAALSLGVLVGLGAIGTSAFWTDEATVNSGGFSAGAIHLDLAGNVRVKPETYAWTSMALTDMIPGSNRAAMLPVHNNSVPSSLRFTYVVQGGYVISGSENAPFASSLQITFYRNATVNGTQTACTGGTIVGTAQQLLTANTSAALLPSQGPVTVGTPDALCVVVGLSADAPNTAQGRAATVRLQFLATSVAP